MNFSPIYTVLCSSLRLSLRLSVFVFVCEYFSFVFAPLIKVLSLSNQQASETYIYASRKMMKTEFMPEHTPDSLRVQTVIYTKQNYSKGFEFFNFLHFVFYRIWKANKYIRAYRSWLLLYAKHLKDVRGNRNNL